LYTWKAIIRTPYGDTEVTVQADNQHIARLLIESKYGRENILGSEVRQA
tara:strand:- start:132 stop:278 length:147 start_codon:yes stop_codon:yes gene_type:complete